MLVLLTNILGKTKQLFKLFVTQYNAVRTTEHGK